MPTIGPWETDDLKVIYHVSEDQFHPPLSSANLDIILEFLLGDIVGDIKYYVTETVYNTYTTDVDFETKLKRCMALCLIRDLYYEHGMTLSTGGQITSESIPDFASVTYRYPSLETSLGRFFMNKDRKDIIFDVLGRYLPADAPEFPLSQSTPVHGAFLEFNTVIDQVDADIDYN